MVSLITAKPHLGFILSGAGLVSGLLTWLQVLTPIVGFAGAVFGMLAGFITLRLKLREWKRSQKH